MEPQLAALILARLTAGEGTGDDVADLVLAACDGREALEDVLGGGDVRAPAPAAGGDELELIAPGAYLVSIEVEGFRGIAAPAKLEFSPGPGLTLVTGRNGSGKSSFAEGLELLMTGTNERWEARPRVWSEGWQNLHATGATRIAARLHVDGEPGATDVEGRWERGATPADGTVGIRSRAGATTLDERGWAAALERFRPFLSYNELAAMFDSSTGVYDTLHRILGLEDIDELGKTLRDARLERDRQAKESKAARERLAVELAAVDDERAAIVTDALARRKIDLDTIELTLEGYAENANAAGELALLRQIALLELPTREAIDAAFAAVARADAALAELAAAELGRADDLAALLDHALRHHGEHAAGDETCMVCGSAGVLTAEWRADATERVASLRARSTEVQAARDGRNRAVRAVVALMPGNAPQAVARAGEAGLDPSAAMAAWPVWANAGSLEARRAALDDLRAACAVLKAAAEAERARREDAWRPLADKLRAWLPGARAVVAAADRVKLLRSAEQWVKDEGAALQAERFAPIADQARHNWERLRQDSSVTLEGITLRRSGNIRSADFDVRVDGTESAALSVMSQGELHALAVSVFLPRAALPESPFRFMVIDDPVQSMDPAKVDGLARVLAEAAADRQVIVFTHDERLFEAVRRLGIPAEVFEVVRRTGSVVTVSQLMDPIRRNISEAIAVARTPGLRDEVVRRVVGGFCRQAIEAACTIAVRRRRLDAGVAHLEVEQALERVHKLKPLLALALFDDDKRAGDVLGSVNNRWGRQAGDAVVQSDRGSHEPVEGDIDDLIDNSRLLARKVALL